MAYHPLYDSSQRSLTRVIPCSNIRATNSRLRNVKCVLSTNRFDVTDLVLGAPGRFPLSTLEKMSVSQVPWYRMAMTLQNPIELGERLGRDNHFSLDIGNLHSLFFGIYLAYEEDGLQLPTIECGILLGFIPFLFQSVATAMY